MAYVIAEPCIDMKDKACVEQCPVDCIYEGPDMFYIHPDECVDCDACEPECPVTAIFPEDDLPGEWKQCTAVNAGWFETTGWGLPVVRRKRAPRRRTMRWRRAGRPSRLARAGSVAARSGRAGGRRMPHPSDSEVAAAKRPPAVVGLGYLVVQLLASRSTGLRAGTRRSTCHRWRPVPRLCRSCRPERAGSRSSLSPYCSSAGRSCSSVSSSPWRRRWR